MVEKKTQQSINRMFSATMTPKTAMDIVNHFCASAAKAGTPVPKLAHEKVAFFRNRGTHYRKEDKNFAELFAAIALFADASVEATRPTDSSSLRNKRLDREEKVYRVSYNQSSPLDPLRQVEEKLTHAKSGKTRIKRDAEWLEDAIHHGVANHKKGVHATWAGIVTTPRAIPQSNGAWRDY